MPIQIEGETDASEVAKLAGTGKILRLASSPAMHKKDPGSQSDGDTMVPPIRRSATAISTTCSWIGMADSVFDHRTAAVVDPTERDDCISRDIVRITVELD